MEEWAHIYVLVDPRNGEIRYVGWTGKGLLERLDAHLKCKDNLYRVHWIASLQRIGLEPRIALVQSVPKSHWSEAERYWIAYFRTAGCALTNATDGGEGHAGGTMSEAGRLATSARMKEHWRLWRESGSSVSEATREKIAMAHRGKTTSPETRAKVSASQTGKPKPLGHGAKISATTTGKPKSPAHRAKIIARNLEMAKRPRTQKQIDGLRAGAARANAKRHKEALARRCG